MNSKLNKREKEVLSLIAEGKTNPEIAGILFVSVGTVKVHVSSIIYKLEAKGRTNAVILEIKYNIIDINSLKCRFG